MFRRLFLLCAAAFIITAMSASARADAVSMISSNFNGTAIAPGSTVWFTNHMKVTGLSNTQPTTIFVTNASVAYGGNVYAIPNARITFSPTASTATTTFDTATNTWVSVIPTSQAGADPFISGLALMLPSGLAGGQNPVVWTATFSATSAVSINWQWGAAVYTDFPNDYNLLGVQTVDGQYQSGTPVNWRSFVTGGARGGGGSNFTGSNSGTAGVEVPANPVPEPTTMILLGTGLVGAALRARRRKVSGGDVN